MSSPLIHPTVGRVVWFYPAAKTAESGFARHADGGGPYAALIAHVWSEAMVNLTVLDADGVPHSRTSVELIPEADDAPDRAFCTWMPFQKGQAKAQDAASTSTTCDVASAFVVLKTALQADSDYAWSWQCNLAMPIMDSSSLGHELANKSAAHLMQHIFGIDMTQHQHFRDLQATWDAEPKSGIPVPDSKLTPDARASATAFRKKPVVIEAITFDQLVAHGVNSGANLVGGVPWSFTYAGHPITHENDDCYLIPTLEGTMRMTRADMLITGVKGEIYPCKREIFDATYEAAHAISDVMSFDVALERLKAGDRIARRGWNGTGQFVYLVPAASYPAQTGAEKAYFGDGALVPYRAYLALKTVDGTVSTWAPSVSDCLADDWTVVLTA